MRIQPAGVKRLFIHASIAGVNETRTRQGIWEACQFYDCVPVSQNQSWRFVFKRGNRSQ